MYLLKGRDKQMFHNWIYLYLTRRQSHLLFPIVAIYKSKLTLYILSFVIIQRLLKIYLYCAVNFRYVTNNAHESRG